MGRTWVVGDVHGCADELAELVERLELAPDDRFVSVGDLFHRGPDPAGVWRVARDLPQFEAILGNHEHAMLRRAAGGASAPEELRGDGNSRLHWGRGEDPAPMLRAVEAMPYWLEGSAPGGPWWITHAGVLPGKAPAETEPRDLVRFHPLKELPGAPLWFEVWEGPPLVVFGHKPFREPLVREHGGRRVAVGLDTGCVYGGSLTAYCIEDERFVAVAARRGYAG